MQKFQVDAIDGIFLVDNFDSNFDELTHEDELVSCLYDLPDSFKIYSEVSDKMMIKLEDIFGINKNHAVL